MKKILFLLAFLVGCQNHPGDFGGACNKDGTCNSPNLECDNWMHSCRVKTPPEEPGRCKFESECFCITCAEKCADAGVKECAYSDTSVWGSKPAICECK